IPVSGRPTNSALLKITQGSSGVSTKSLQSEANAAVGSLSVRAAARPFARSCTSGNNATRQSASPKDRTTTARCQGLYQGVRGRAVGNAGVTTEDRTAGSGAAGGAIRGLKTSEYAPLGTSMIQGSAAPPWA